MSSFTDGKQRIATEQDVHLNWSGSKDGLRFRCKMCGYKFKVGDKWRFIWANIKDSPTRTGNFVVCDACDSAYKYQDKLLLKRMAQIEEEAYTKFWWLIEDDHQLRRWTITNER